MHNKTIAAFGAIFALLLFLGAASVVKMTELADWTRKLYEHPFTVTNATKSIEAHFISMHLYMKDIVLAGSDKEILTAVEQIDASEIAIYKEFDIIFERYLGDKADISASYDAFARWKPIRDEVIFLMKSGQKEKAAAITKGRGADHVKMLGHQVNKLIVYARNKAELFYNNSIRSKSESIFFIKALIGVILAIVVSIFIFLVKTLRATERETKKYFHLIDQNIMSAVFDSKLNIVDASSALVRHFAMTKEEMLKTAPGFFLSGCAEEERKKIKREICSGKAWNGELKQDGDHGGTQWFYCQIHPSFDEDYAVTGYSVILDDITSKKQLEEISNMDGLTGLGNRRYFDELFPRVIRMGNRRKTLLAFAMIDIDYFKQYNDTYGHQAGDSALKRVAYVLKHSLQRPDDYIFRLGGEEFGLLYTVSDADDGMKIADMVREKVQQMQIPHESSRASDFVTISMGVVIIGPTDDLSPDEIYKRGDVALYLAKHNGRNRAMLADF